MENFEQVEKWFETYDAWDYKPEIKFEDLKEKLHPCKQVGAIMFLASKLKDKNESYFLHGEHDTLYVGSSFDIFEDFEDQDISDWLTKNYNAGSYPVRFDTSKPISGSVTAFKENGDNQANNVIFYKELNHKSYQSIAKMAVNGTEIYAYGGVTPITEAGDTVKSFGAYLYKAGWSQYASDASGNIGAIATPNVRKFYFVVSKINRTNMTSYILAGLSNVMYLI